MKIRILILLLCALFAFTLSAQKSNMTDEQVLELVNKSLQQGMDKKAVAMELARRGVTKEQALRVKEIYDRTEQATPDSLETSRLRVIDNDRFVEDLNIANESDSSDIDINGQRVIKRDQVYGRNVFNTKNLSFEPSVNIATPPDYRLGPGDEVIIDIWGTSQTTIRKTISPDGNIIINDIGLVSLNGMTIKSAENYLRRVLNKIYDGIDSSNPKSHLKLTLGNIRTIQVNVMGEVTHPGTYSLSSFSTVFHALYRAGGVTDIGSLRDIQLMRYGRKIADVDVYNFIMSGYVSDIRLQENDVIIIPSYEALIRIDGKVKRPMKYEIKSGETLKTALKYAGGVTDDAYTRSIKVIRQNGKEHQLFTVDFINFSVFKLMNGDVITVEPILDRFENKLEIKGAVYRPGIYEYGGKLNTLKELIDKADGLRGDAFLGRAELRREREDLTLEMEAVDISGIMNGSKPDILLRRNDVLYVPSIHDLKDFGNIYVHGEVMRPGSYVFADNMTLEDLIIQCGGLKESASTVRVDISRRIKNSKSTNSTSALAQTYSFALKDGFVVDGDIGFILEPFDEVYVRKSPGYNPQMNVHIDGEVLYDGDYSLSYKNERLSSLVNRAGGVTPFAYVKGARLMRVANEEEIARMRNVIEMISRESDETNPDSLKLDVAQNYSVGIDLLRALAKPYSTDDIVLREGDRLIVPQLMNTVKINGAVMMPNTVSYIPKQSVRDYIDQAGGFANRARKSRIFVVYMNGKIDRVSRNDKRKIEPGCEIIVPVKEKRSPLGLQGILGIASSISSLGLTAAAIANILK